jgi:hypothetical protein
MCATHLDESGKHVTVGLRFNQDQRAVDVLELEGPHVRQLRAFKDVAEVLCFAASPDLVAAVTRRASRVRAALRLDLPLDLHVYCRSGAQHSGAQVCLPLNRAAPAKVAWRDRSLVLLQPDGVFVREVFRDVCDALTVGPPLCLLRSTGVIRSQSVRDLTVSREGHVYVLLREGLVREGEGLVQVWR